MDVHLVDEKVQLSKGQVHYRLERPKASTEEKARGVPVVICVHGIDHVARVWDFLASHLASTLGYAVLSFDMYDRGGSKLDHHQPHTADLFVEQLHELWERVIVDDKEREPSVEHRDKDEKKKKKKKKKNKEKEEEEKKEEAKDQSASLPPLCKDSFALVGHSMGGAVSMLFSHRYPDLVNALVLIGPAGMKFSVPAEMQLMRLPALGPKLFQWFAKQEDMMKEDFMDLKASKSAIEHVMEHTKGMYGTSAFAHAFINSFKNFPLRDLEDIILEVGKHERPSLVMWGEHDRLISREEWLPRFEEAFGVGRVANHRSAIIANTKHSAFLERPDEANRLIGDFLQGKELRHNDDDDDDDDDEEGGEKSE